jgi:hypothetical protein
VMDKKVVIFPNLLVNLNFQLKRFVSKLCFFHKTKFEIFTKKNFM